MRTCHYIAVGIIAAQLGSGVSMAADEHNPAADPKALVLHGKARFTVLTPRLIRMQWSPDAVFEDRASFAFVNRRLPAPSFDIDISGQTLTITTEAFKLKFVDDGQPFSAENLAVESRGRGVEFVWRPGMLNRGNLKGTIRTLDGVSGSAELPDGLLSRDGWTLVDDSDRLLFDAEGWATQRRASAGSDTPKSNIENPKPQDWYFFAYGHDYRQALRDFTAVAGRIPLPPRYVFGAWWSRYWAYSDAELRELVEEFDKHEVPLDVLVIDMDWHLDGWTGYTWNPKYFPDPAGFLKWCTERGLRVTLNLHPADGVGKHESQFADFCRALGVDAAKSERVPFDCADPRYMDAYFKLLHHPFEQMGVDFWWIDWQQGTDAKIPGLDPLFWLNHLHFKDMADRVSQTEHRPLIFSRWGGLGNHRYQIGFSGDTFCDWRSLAFQPYFTATAGNVGYAFWSHDIGGHQPGRVDAELYTRWIQWGALSPCLRTHTTKNAEAERRIWKFDSEFFEASRAAFQLRYELLPYIYSMARKTYDESLPICRPLYYHWPEEDEAYRRPSHYMFGDDLLVAPVTSPVNPQTRCATIEVWFPPGGWTDWFTGRWYAGPRLETLSVPLDEVPLFVRDGAIIPTQPVTRRSDESPADSITLNVFGGRSGETTIYEDDGLSDQYRGDKFSRTRVAFVRRGEQVEVTIAARQGTYANMPVQRRYVVRVHNVPPPPVTGALNPAVVAHWQQGDYGAQYFPETGMMEFALPRHDAGVSRSVLAELSPVRHAADCFARGLRGQLAVLAELRARLDQQAPACINHLYAAVARMSANPAKGDQILLDALGEFPEVIAAVMTAPLKPAERGHFLTRLLGMTFELRIGELSPDGAGMTAIATLRLDPPLGQVAGLKADLRLAEDGASATTAAAIGVADGEAISARLTLSGGDRAQNQPITARAKLTLNDAQLELAIQKTLLPSINSWWIAGPFDAPFETGLATVFPPELGFDAGAAFAGRDGAKLGWRRCQRAVQPGDEMTDEFFVHLHNFYGERVNHAVAYGFTYLHAPRDMDASLAIGSDDGVAVWLNGAEIHRKTIGRPYSPKQDRVAVKLKSGVNRLLLKVNQGGGDWGFSVFVETPDGRPLPEVVATLEP